MQKIELAVQNERYYLGALLKDGSLIEEASLSPGQFLDPRNQALFKAMQGLRKLGRDISVIALAHLGESKNLAFGGSKYLGELMNDVPSVHAFKNYERYVLDYWTVEKAQTYANEFLKQSEETFDVDHLRGLIANVNGLEEQTVRKSHTFKDLLVQRYDEHEATPPNRLSGTDTGFMSLNALTDGWQPGEITIIGARPSMGKTAFALNGILNGCEKQEVMATFFSIEMAEGQIIDRFLATKGKINLMKMRNPNKLFLPDEWGRYTKALAELEPLNIDIRDDYTVPEIRAATRRNVKNNPDIKHVVYIDYLTLIRATKEKQSRHHEVEEIVQDLKQMAKDLHVPVVVLAQLSRSLEQRQNKRPMMSDLRESGAIEQAADGIMFLYRDEYYNRNAEPGRTEILVAKQRNGRTGTLDMNFVKETNTFRELA